MFKACGLKEKTKPGKSSSFQENIKFLLNLTSIAFLIVNTQLNPPNEEMQQFSELGMGSLWKKNEIHSSFQKLWRRKPVKSFSETPPQPIHGKWREISGNNTQSTAILQGPPDP